MGRRLEEGSPITFLVDFAQEVYREVHVYALDGSTRPDRPCEIHVGRKVGPCVVHRVEFGGGDCSSPGGTLLFLHRVLA